MKYRKRPVVIEAFQWKLYEGPEEREWPYWLHEAAERLTWGRGHTFDSGWMFLPGRRRTRRFSRPRNFSRIKRR